ncbi:MAG: DUF819 domain-containing protein [Sulfurimonas sp.]|nr:MAG: DUF819 domain-containing protein [Sulfurimonas sp.]
MIESSLVYLLTIALIAALFGIAEHYRLSRVFKTLPAVVLIYAAAMLLASLGLWERNDAITHTYETVKNNLLPAMLFLMLLQLDFKAFAHLGRPLIVAYISATVSIALAFIAVFFLFDFNAQQAGLFSALCGSWMGGTANMLAVASALDVNETMMGYALIVDSVDYALWVMLLLALVPWASYFNRFSGATAATHRLNRLGCACEMGAPKYWSLLLLAVGIALLTQLLAATLEGLSTMTWVVLLATVFGVAASLTPIRQYNGSSRLATTMLYLLVALIGSRASFEGMGAIPLYLFAGICILTLHAMMMLIAAKLFKLDLFSIAVASLANIGGVASAPILAAAYHRSLIGVAVLMAIMGYLIGTVAGLGVAGILQRMAS